MLEPEAFAILPWGWTPGDPDALREIRTCGFNLAGFVAPGHLDLVREAGLKGIVSDSSIQVGDAEAGLDEAEIDRRAAALVQRVGKHPAVFGYYLKDEPGARFFPGLGRWVEALRKGLAHRPLNPDTEGHQTFRRQLEAQREALLSEYPHMDFSTGV